MKRSNAGKIILLNGASSAGKSTLARALQSALAEPFWHLSIDHLRESGALPLSRIRSGEFDWPSLRPAFFDGFHRSLASWVDAGNNLLVEHIIETESWLIDLADILSPFDVFTVLLRCPLPELETRERDRPGKGHGEARRDFENIYDFAVSDLELDGTAPPEINVDRLRAAWAKREAPSALSRIAARAVPS